MVFEGGLLELGDEESGFISFIRILDIKGKRYIADMKTRTFRHLVNV